MLGGQPLQRRDLLKGQGVTLKTGRPRLCVWGWGGEKCSVSDQDGPACLRRARGRNQRSFWNSGLPPLCPAPGPFELTPDRCIVSRFPRRERGPMSEFIQGAFPWAPPLPGAATDHPPAAAAGDPRSSCCPRCGREQGTRLRGCSLPSPSSCPGCDRAPTEPTAQGLGRHPQQASLGGSGARAQGRAGGFPFAPGVSCAQDQLGASSLSPGPSRVLGGGGQRQAGLTSEPLRVRCLQGPARAGRGSLASGHLGRLPRGRSDLQSPWDLEGLPPGRAL